MLKSRQKPLTPTLSPRGEGVASLEFGRFCLDQKILAGALIWPRPSREASPIEGYRALTLRG